MKVLIAEDEPVSRHLLVTTLRNSGYDLIVCSDGAEAWQAIQRGEAPELLILDWMMPAVDGLELCRRVREMPGPGAAYIIILTARGRTEDIIVGVQAGADDYIIKPFDPEDLVTRVQVAEWLVKMQKKGPHSDGGVRTS